MRDIRIFLPIALCGLFFPWALASAPPERPGYPHAPRGDTVDTLFGTKLAAPYRWMEDLNSPAVARWVEEENRVTSAYLDGLPERAGIRDRLTRLWNYAKVSVPQVEAGHLFFTKNTGLQNQSVVFEQDSPEAAPREVIDPNTLSPNGDVALLQVQPSRDARYLAYGLSRGGSDWQTLHVREVASGKDLADTIEHVKFSGISWTNDNRGFFYSRYPAPPAGEAISDRVVIQTLYYHRLGTPQAEDPVIYTRPDLPEWVVAGFVSEDGRYLFVALYHGSSPNNELLYADLKDPSHPDLGARIEPLYTKTDAAYSPIGNIGDTVYLQTTRDAPRDRIVAFRLPDPDPAHWRTVVPEGPNVIDASLLAGGRVVVKYLADVVSEVDVFSSEGHAEGALSLPGLGSVEELSGRNDSPDLYFGFASYLYPLSVYRADLKTARTSVFFKPDLTFDPSRYETRRVFYSSKDGARIPMLITCRKDVKLDGHNSTLLYGYGGFDVSETPNFRPYVPVWLEMGGVYAVANLRGGGEYGEAWHQAGMLSNKQTVFDDFAAAARYLIDQKYASPKTLGIWGYSNGGLLVGASITQHPELFGAAYAGAGVMDMLRYQKFSGGALWATEYGSADEGEKAFHWLLAYSPVQNVKPGVCYPPTIITTADHDDRVVPSHSYKFAAAMQHDQACANPVLIRVETKTSHNYMPTDKKIAQWADVWTFLAHNLGLKAPPEADRK